MLTTILRLTASRASSPGVQCETGNPLSPGGSQAKAMIAAICSGVNVAGAPLRSSSVRIARIRLSKSLAVAPSASAVAKPADALAQRARQRRTRCRSTPNSSARSSLSRPSADKRTMRQRSTNRWGALRARAKGSSTARCLDVNVILAAFLPKIVLVMPGGTHGTIGCKSQSGKRSGRIAWVALPWEIPAVKPTDKASLGEASECAGRNDA